MSNVVDLDVNTKLDIPASKVLGRTLEADLSEAVVLGWDQNGSLYFSSTKADGGDILWLIEVAKAQLINGAVEE